jgi:hypothetical protein
MGNNRIPLTISKIKVMHERPLKTSNTVRKPYEGNCMKQNREIVNINVGVLMEEER